MTRLSAYRWLSHHLSKPLAVAAVVLVCASLFAATNPVGATGPSYPALFREHVSELTPTQLAAHHPSIERYLTFVNTLSSNPDWQADFAALYAEELYFSDNFLVADQRPQIAAHYASLIESEASLRIIAHDVVSSEAGTYLVWSVVNEFSVLGRSVAADVVGVTLFNFDAQGRITLQQDFWDTAEGFYQHLPIVGSFIKVIRNGFAA